MRKKLADMSFAELTEVSDYLKKLIDSYVGSIRKREYVGKEVEIATYNEGVLKIIDVLTDKRKPFDDEIMARIEYAISA